MAALIPTTIGADFVRLFDCTALVAYAAWGSVKCPGRSSAASGLCLGCPFLGNCHWFLLEVLRGCGAGMGVRWVCEAQWCRCALSRLANMSAIHATSARHQLVPDNPQPQSGSPNLSSSRTAQRGSPCGWSAGGLCAEFTANDLGAGPRQSGEHSGASGRLSSSASRSISPR